MSVAKADAAPGSLDQLRQLQIFEQAGSDGGMAPDGVVDRT